MGKKKRDSSAIINRRARFDYELGEVIQAGIVLNGLEVRAARDGHVQLRGAYVTIKNDELWLTNASFSLKSGGLEPTVDTHPRKLLISKKQLGRLATAKKQGMTIVPLKLSNKTRYIKLDIALAKGKKKYDKRETLKRRDAERESQRARKHTTP